MKMKIDENYHVESEANSWNLHYEEIRGISDKTGEQIVKRDVSYHGRLKDALKFYLNETMKEATDVTDLIARIELAEANIDRMAK